MMKFDSYIPNDILKPYIKRLVVSEADVASVYKVLPDTGLVVGFQYKGHLSVMNGNTEMSLSTAGITGLQDTCRLFKNTPSIGTILVYFRDTGASAFFRMPVHELFRETISLDTFIVQSELVILEEQLSGELQDQQRIQLVEQFLMARLHPASPDPLVSAALSLIYASRGNIRIAELAKVLNTSQSPLEKRFRSQVGASPKKFASLIRFKHIIESYNPQASLTSVGYDAGFFDQAHFIKEFKRFTGETPDHFFSANS